MSRSAIHNRDSQADTVARQIRFDAERNITGAAGYV